MIKRINKEAPTVVVYSSPTITHIGRPNSQDPLAVDGIPNTAHMIPVLKSITARVMSRIRVDELVFFSFGRTIKLMIFPDIIRMEVSTTKILLKTGPVHRRVFTPSVSV